MPSIERERINEIKASFKTMNSRLLEFGTDFMFVNAQN